MVMSRRPSRVAAGDGRQLAGAEQAKPFLGEREENGVLGGKIAVKSRPDCTRPWPPRSESRPGRTVGHTNSSRRIENGTADFGMGLLPALASSQPAGGMASLNDMILNGVQYLKPIKE